MGHEEPRRPQERSWVAAVYTDVDASGPSHAAVVIDQRRVLTCRHGLPEGPVWVEFPFADGAQRHRAHTAAYGIGAKADVAVLLMEGAMPAGVSPAPLRTPRNQDLEDLSWWAYGFPRGDALGQDAHGQVATAAGHGWFRLKSDAESSIAPGFSGAGVWSADYQAVVAVVGQWHTGGQGRALTLAHADQCLPEHDLASLAAWSLTDADAQAQAAWGWSLESDPQAGRHWKPRARGVTRDSIRGWRFRGRTAALKRITAELSDAKDRRRVLVVTGSPGVGKSAVLARVVTTADGGIRAQLPAEDAAVRAEVGSVACAVHAQGKTALEVATEIARAASAAIPNHVEDFPRIMTTALEHASGRAFAVVIDALDEAASPREARTIATKVAQPLAEDRTITRVVVGTRRRDDQGDLIRTLGPAELVDLDAPEFFAEEDLAAYAHATLQLFGDERPGNPYTEDAVAGPVARRIAERSSGNFLVAGGYLSRCVNSYKG